MESAHGNAQTMKGEEIMGERWLRLGLGEYETLRCDSCLKMLRSNQKAHLYDADDEIVEVMCDSCWKKNQKEREI